MVAGGPSVAGLGAVGPCGPRTGISSGILPGNSSGRGDSPGSRTGGGMSGCGLPGGDSIGGSVGLPGVAGGISGGSIGIYIATLRAVGMSDNGPAVAMFLVRRGRNRQLFFHQQRVAAGFAGLGVA